MTVNTSVIQKLKHDSWVTGINLPVKLHASDGKEDQVSVLPHHTDVFFCRKSGNIFWQHPGNYQDLRSERTLNLQESSRDVASHSNTLLLLGSWSTDIIVGLINVVVISFSYAKTEYLYSAKSDYISHHSYNMYFNSLAQSYKIHSTQST